MNPILVPETFETLEILNSAMLDKTSVTAQYRIRSSPDAVERVCRNIAYEQTVEVPPELADSDERVQRWVGRVVSIEAVSGIRDTFDAKIVYDSLLTGGQLPQLLNLLFGNTSLQKNVTLVDVDLPDEFVNRFTGPKFGVEGLRRLLGVYGRPLLATALKPVGLNISEFAELAFEFSLGGGDLVKDDHNLHDASFGAFQERIARCHEAVCKANAQTGRNTLYLPNLMVPVEEIERHVKYALSLGIRGMLVSPFLAGLDTIRSLAQRYSMVVMAHPTFSGAYCVEPRHGVETGLLLGKIFRLIGADLSIFPNSGGRFSFSEADCLSITRQLRAPLGQLKTAWPAPAGGMRFDNLGHMVRQYGEDAAILMGGALLSHSNSLRLSTRELLKRIEAHFPSQLVEPETEFTSACELPRNLSNAVPPKPVLKHLPALPEGGWEGRSAASYKASKELPFRDVVRHELLGQFGEQTEFDLRYFEIAPGGFSSLEKHAHTHAIISVKGQGQLTIGSETFVLKPLDVAYVPPMEVHQLRNDSTEPFGFFCIVNHFRDRPQQP